MAPTTGLRSGPPSIGLTTIGGMPEALTLPEGWLTSAEAAALAEIAAGKTVLEIGAWLGRSTVALARSARLVVSVDHHHGPPYDGNGSTLQRFLSNLERLGIKN